MTDDRVREITMQDVRLMAGEGKLSAHDVLKAVNAHLRMHQVVSFPRACRDATRSGDDNDRRAD